MTTGYLSPKLEVRTAPEKGGFAVFAREMLAKDEVLVGWGGRVVTFDEVLALLPEERGHTLQIDEALFLAPISLDEPADFVNHSCNPNAGIRGQVVLVALRAIAAGEEITFDYAMSDSSPFDEFECACGAPDCRGRVRCDDWKRPELWARYDGYFSVYLQRKIELMRKKVMSKEQ